MSEFWTWGKYVSFENCIEANKICNLNNCPNTMNCCVTNCIGIPTIRGIVLGVSITVIVLFFFLIFNTLSNTLRIANKNKDGSIENDFH